MADLLTIEALFTLFMLILLQAVLGFDNLLYIAIESNKVGDPTDAKKVRKYGIAIAVILRIVLLFLIVNLFTLLAEPLFGIHLGGFISGDFTAQALITLVGGAFIIYTAIKEIHHLLQVDHIEHSEGGGTRTVMGAIALIVAMNLVFSVDSILSAMAIASVDAANVVNSVGDTLGQFAGTVAECKRDLIANPVLGAVGCEPTKTYQVPLMVIAILVSGLGMILLADRVTEFLKKNRMYQVLGLFILFLVGVLLVTEGAHLAHLKLFGFAIDAMSKSSFYLVVGVLVVTDVLSNRYQKRLWAQKEAEIRGTTETAGREAVDEWKSTH
ncbi:TerC family protein [Litorimonas sp. RW-G-Af-16]|uniref:TerC family protein n=1 Tax=Litorimonas sp. RW-G-Af-16 TaxID=3241168 RepID=UPI00390CC1EF